ncbi:DUF190 domain-containing protein [Desulfovermiculus halophilus]|uniref:DUF190 domain-containing protein n=1 Tax=Desulfovermiculus halophilus TaxID=339722 RepID=UPI000486CB71|nr:DUF190 domain-containing protein [Desulfovermiculus halophilus]
MDTLRNALRLRAYIGENDHYNGKPLYQVIVEEAKSYGLAGATAFRGFLGFGAGTRIHSSKILRLSEELPVIVDIVDTKERIEAFWPHVNAMVASGTLTLETVQAAFHMPLRVRDVMSMNPVTLHPDDSLEEAVNRLLSHQVKALPVVRDNKAVGIITGGDLLSRGGLQLRLDLHPHLPDQTRQEQMLALRSKTAADVMSTPVQTISITATIQEAARVMSARSIKRLLVVDEHGNMAGIVSRVDILRTFVRAADFSDQLPELPPGLDNTVDQLMFTEVATVTPQDGLQEVVRKMVQTPLRRVVVVDTEDNVRGVILDRDLISLFSRNREHGLLSGLISLLAAKPESPTLFSGTAQDVMRESVFSVPEGTPVKKALDLMLDHGIKRLVVTDGQGRLRGMIDRDVTLKALGRA